MIALGKDKIFYLRGNRSVVTSCVSDNLDAALLIYLEHTDDSRWIPKKGEFATIMNPEGRSKTLKCEKVVHDYSINNAATIFIFLGDTSMESFLQYHAISNLAKEVRNLKTSSNRKIFKLTNSL